MKLKPYTVIAVRDGDGHLEILHWKLPDEKAAPNAVAKRNGDDWCVVAVFKGFQTPGYSLYGVEVVS